MRANARFKLYFELLFATLPALPEITVIENSTDIGSRDDGLSIAYKTNQLVVRHYNAYSIDVNQYLAAYGFTLHS